MHNSFAQQYSDYITAKRARKIEEAPSQSIINSVHIKSVSSGQYVAVLVCEDPLSLAGPGGVEKLSISMD